MWRGAGWLQAGGLVACWALLAGSAEAHDSTAAQGTVLAPGYGALEFAAPRAGTYRLPPVAPAADAPYVDSHGERGTLHALFDGHVTILGFIYTHCDDVNGCPLASFVMAKMAKRLASDAAIAPVVRLISFSFDPRRDTPEALERYARTFRPPGVRWDFVTSPDQESLARTLAAYQQSIQSGAGGAYAHVLRVFVIDGAKRIRNVYSPAFLHADTLAADVETIMQEEGGTPAPTGHAPASVADDAARVAEPWLGLPPESAMNGPEASPAQIALGERLFFDRRLSLNRTLSCAMCHVPAQGFTVNDLATSVGIEGRTVKRNAPTLLNVGWLSRLFHDAREDRLEQQVWGPLLQQNEMGNPSVGYVIDNLTSWPEYRGSFEAAFGAGPNMMNVGAALAAYERTLIAGGSPFDRWYYAHDASAIGDEARRGFEIFRGKGRCSSCHTFNDKWALFTDEKLHDTGVSAMTTSASKRNVRTAEIAPGVSIRYDLASVSRSAETPPTDLGRYEVTQDPQDRWKFLTPSLRNVALTAPYMHNGLLRTLDDVVAYYNRGGERTELLDPLIQPLGLSDAECAELVAFLRSLTSPAVATLAARGEAVAIGNPAVAGGK